MIKCEHDILSLGAGVQSSTLLLMSLHNETPYTIQSAIFSDTQCEGKKVYEWLSFLKKVVGNKVKIIETTKGNLLSDALFAKRRFASLPLFVKNTDGKVAMIKRQCTGEYKINPVKSVIAQIVNKKYHRNFVRQWIGISTDEMGRMKLSGMRYISNFFPLIEMRMSRIDCIAWLTKNGYPSPPKSSCIICPFHGDEYWLDLLETDPDSFEIACEFDKAIRWKLTRFKFKSPAYLHRSCIPLKDVKFINGQGKLFSNLECSGTCFT